MPLASFQVSHAFLHGAQRRDRVAGCHAAGAAQLSERIRQRRENRTHVFRGIQQMGIILDKLFGGGSPIMESKMDTAGSCQSKCCDTEVVSLVSSSSSDSHHTHASHHVRSRPSFETLPPSLPPPELRRELTTACRRRSCDLRE